MHQRLACAALGPEELEVVAPADANLAPPGHYMLFILNGAGVPAVAPIVQLVSVGAEEEDMGRIAELEAELTEKNRQVAELENVTGYLTGDIVDALRSTLRLRRLREMKEQVDSIANEIARHRPG